MKSWKTKVCVLAVMSGTIFQFGGCFGGIARGLVAAIPVNLGLEFLTDNDAIFDLFEDGTVAAAPAAG